MKWTTLLAPALLFSSAAAHAQDASTNFCALTASDAQSSCHLRARSDNLLALGKCENGATANQRQTCRQQAAATLTEANKQCGLQYAVRLSACQTLGPQPYDPPINPADFTDKIDNPLFPLVPGTAFIYETKTSSGPVKTVFFITRQSRKILGVNTVVVHDGVFTSGKLTEDTFDYFAQDREGNVWYFGEYTEELVDGHPSTLAGTFIAGENGTTPGIVMEAHPEVGDFYRQEFDLGNAEDFARVAALNDTVTVPAGRFTQCLRSTETTPLEPNLKEAKWYAAGIGNVLTKDLVSGETSQLVRIEKR